MVTLNKSVLSLQVGVWEQLTASTDVTWSSNNPNVHVDSNGWVIALRDVLRTDTPNGQATITATALDATYATCKITIVSWTANKKELTLADTLPDYYGMAIHDGYIYGVNINSVLCRSNDGFATTEVLGAVPGYPYGKLLFTPFGCFLRGRLGIYHSTDYVNWELSFALPGLVCLLHSFDYYYDTQSSTLYIYTGEYTADASTDSTHHKVYRGTITANGETWETILDFYPLNEKTTMPTDAYYARHVHATIVDQYTGDLWVNTGDTDDGCRWLCSNDNGNTFRVVGAGSQEWRSLSIWFTTDNIYWNMDSSVNTAIWRIPRAELESHDYIINDKREKVIELVNGSMWYHVWAKDEFNEDIVVFCGTPEGQKRDWLARVWIFKELADNTVEINEVMCLPSVDGTYNPMAQMQPYVYKDGYIYLKTREITPSFEFWKMTLDTKIKSKRLVWKNNLNFKA